MEKLTLFLENLYLFIRVGILDRIQKPGYYKSDSIDKVYPHFSRLLKESEGHFVKNKCNNYELILNYENEASRVTTSKLLNKKYDSDKPNLIFHHGAGEVAYLTSAKVFLRYKLFEKYNVFFVRASHHRNRKDYLKNCQSSFTKWMLTFAGSVLMVEEMIRVLPTPTVVSGISMGGIVSTLHFLEFNSAKYYVPLLAFNDVSDVFLNSMAFSRAIDHRKERKKNISLMRAFHYENNNSNMSVKKVFPFLGKYDRYIDYKKASQFWDGFGMKTYNVGHTSFIIKAEEVRQTYLELAY